jgi:hypothetical protein
MPSSNKKKRSKSNTGLSENSSACRSATNGDDDEGANVIVAPPRTLGSRRKTTARRKGSVRKPKKAEAKAEPPETVARLAHGVNVAARTILSEVLNPRTQLGDAMRKRGLDEHAIAEGYVHVVQTLTARTDSTGNVDKLLVDVLKECSRHLAPPERTGPGDAPVFVQLIHNVPRPERSERALAPRPPELTSDDADGDSSLVPIASPIPGTISTPNLGPISETNFCTALDPM